jgi:hypothetical protein
MTITQAVRAISSGNIKPLIIENLPVVKVQIIDFLQKLEDEAGERKTVLFNIIKKKNGESELMVTIGKTETDGRKIEIDMEKADKKTFVNFAESLINN